jgi:hypothetical protein
VVGCVVHLIECESGRKGRCMWYVSVSGFYAIVLPDQAPHKVCVCGFSCGTHGVVNCPTWTVASAAGCCTIVQRTALCVCVRTVLGSKKPGVFGTTASSTGFRGSTGSCLRQCTLMAQLLQTAVCHVVASACDCAAGSPRNSQAACRGMGGS